jgi:hypothetical protein
VAIYDRRVRQRINEALKSLESTITTNPIFAGLTLVGFSGIIKATDGVLSSGSLADSDIPNDITLTNITQITNRSHTNLTDVGSLTHATIDGYLDQSVKQAASPTFVTAKLTGLTDGYIPKHTSDAVGLVNSSLYSDTDGNIYFVGSGTGLPYGEIYIDNGHTTQTLTTSFAKVTAFNDADHGFNGVSNLMTPDKVNSKITITTAGTYKIHAVFSGQSTKVSIVYLALFVGGTEQNNVESEVNTVENGYLALCADGLVTIAANTDIDIRLKYVGAEAAVVTCAHVNLNAVMVGG